MSKYTTEVRYICEHSAGLSESTGMSSVNETIQKAIPKIFDFAFPIYDESYRNVLETKILKHYYTREIGLETVGLWKLKLDTRLNEIMPYYNQLYKSTLLDFNPLHDVDVTTSRTTNGSGTKDDNGTTNTTTDSNENYSKTNTGTSTIKNESTDTTTTKSTTSGERTDTGNTTINNTTTTNTTGNNWDYYSDTPQGGLTGIENNTYLTDVRHKTDSGTTTSNDNGTTETTNSGTTSSTINGSDTSVLDGTSTTTNDLTETNTGNTNQTVTSTTGNNASFSNTEEYIEHITGKTAGSSYAKMILEFRETLVNIDMLIIDNLSDLFINLW